LHREKLANFVHKKRGESAMGQQKRGKQETSIETTKGSGEPKPSKGEWESVPRKWERGRRIQHRWVWGGKKGGGRKQTSRIILKNTNGYSVDRKGVDN